MKTSYLALKIVFVISTVAVIFGIVVGFLWSSISDKILRNVSIASSICLPNNSMNNLSHYAFSISGTHIDSKVHDLWNMEGDSDSNVHVVSHVQLDKRRGIYCQSKRRETQFR